jgi:DNA polymerase-4
MPGPDLCKTTFRGLSGGLPTDPQGFADYTPLIEPLSLDEAYLDVTENLKGMSVATEIALDIRERIEAVTDLNASAGISHNKFLAKMASDLNKPNGQAVITPKNGPPFIEALPVKKFHGVGPGAMEKMHRLGIETGADLKAHSLHFLTQHFGKSGPYFYGIARGIDGRQIRPDRARKSVGAEDTFMQDIDNLDLATGELSHLSRRSGAIARPRASVARPLSSRSSIPTSPKRPVAGRLPFPFATATTFSTPRQACWRPSIRSNCRYACSA